MPYDNTIYGRTNERAHMRSRDLTSQLNAALSSAQHLIEKSSHVISYEICRPILHYRIF